MALNYASQPDRERVDGYLFLSPQLGFRSLTARPTLTAPFVSVDGPAFAAHAISGGLTHGHAHAVRFNYPPEVLASDPTLIASITVNTSLALTPSAPSDQFVSLDRPFGLWIGANDELFLPQKVLEFASLARSVRRQSEAAEIAGAKHLSILANAHAVIGPWIERAVRRGEMGDPVQRPDNYAGTK